MRQRQIRQIGQGIRLLGQAHNELKKQLERHAPDEAGNLLEQCQQYAIELGQMIEAEEGEGTEAVRLLEDYCEQIYRIYQDREQMQRSGFPGKVYKRLRQLLVRLEDEVRNHIPVQREVVFLPYKASMWDSLESIWRAASDDLDCDAYVIPIPYYDKNPDGSFNEMHYEGDLYPDDVPVIDYREYDFANRCPDMIFIHNPYDECNYVTSVHPFFYAKNLKQYTEQLIYVPYFVLGEPDPDHEDAVEHISHFCTCPGVIYADKVIVQSEAMRQVYIHVLSEFMAGHGYERKDLEKKILGLGSPKVDRVLSLRKEDLEIPDEWKKKIQKADGGWKKIVLYNTSVNAFLQNSKKMLRKIEEVFKIFRDKKEEIVLLWRPHPLMQATVKSMRPQLWEEYRNIIEEYQREDWGIYDDTPDLDRAVVLCDAYYGDPSSVVQLCRKAGKTVVLQNLDAAVSAGTGEILDKGLTAEGVYDDGHNLWFAENDYNALFRMEKDGFCPELKGIFPGEKFMQKRLYVSSGMCNGKLYFAPGSAEEIAEYEIQKNTFRKIPLCMPRKKCPVPWKCAKFSGTAAAGDRIYFVPDRYPGILCYDVKSDVICCFDDWVDKIERLRVFDTGYFLGYVRAGNRLILPCMCAPAVVVFDMDEGTAQVIRTQDGGEGFQYSGIVHIDDWFYLVSGDGTLRKRKLESEEEEVREIVLPVSGGDTSQFYPMQYADGYLYLFPLKRDRGIKFDIRTGHAEKETLYGDEKEFTGEKLPFLTSWYSGGKLYAFTGNSRCLAEYDFEKNKKREIVLLSSGTDRTCLKKQKREEYARISGAEYIREGEIYPLTYVLDILEKDNRTENVEKEQPDTGVRIYHTLLKEQTIIY